MKRTQPRRSWTAARAKIEREGFCRVCGSPEDLQAAHTYSRRDQDVELDDGSLLVKSDAVVPLCGPFSNDCHGRYDRREIDLLPYVDVFEQLSVVEAAGGIVSAFQRLSGRRIND